MVTTMSRVRRAALTGGVVLGLILVSSSAWGEFRAGIAVRRVTPEPLLSVSGGVGPSEPATKKLGQLTVRALVLADADTKVAIVSTDFLGFPAFLGDRVRKEVPEIPPENILIGATHTHSAPDCYGFPDGKGGTSADEKYLEWVCSRIAEAIGEAHGNLIPASLKIATERAEGKIAYNYYAERLYDPRCDVLQALDASGCPIATLVNYAIHPEVLGSDQGVLSPDLIGPLYERIASRGGGTGIFLNGALGGMVTADCRGPDGKDLRTWAECVRIGQLLADQALRIVEPAAVQKEPALECRSRVVTFPIDAPLMRQVIDASPMMRQWIRGRPEGEQGPAVSTRVNLVDVGTAQILTIPGEALPNIGYYLKRKMRGEHNLLFGLTNDAFGYILTKEDFDSFERYEYISRTSLGERTCEIYISGALGLVESGGR